MGLPELDLRISYDSGFQDLLEDFYIPVLETAKYYDRIAGFFSSSSLAIAAKGLAGLIANEGKIRMLVCPRLDRSDIQVLEENRQSIYSENNHRVNQIDIDFISQTMIDSIIDFRTIAETEHLKAFGWMLSRGYLTIKVVVKEKCTDVFDLEKIFHQKIGIVTDTDNHQISFSGSINETASGWTGNVEEFKVFKGWEAVQKDYLAEDIYKFQAYWNDNVSGIRTLDIPFAVKAKLIEVSNDFDKEKYIAKYYRKEKDLRSLSLFSFQKEAIEKWKSNDKKLLFQMATGTGKTRTAIGCILNLIQDVNSILIIIATPGGTLTRQWKSEVEKLCPQFVNSIVADSTNNGWKEQLRTDIRQINVGILNNYIVYTTHSTASSDDFLQITAACRIPIFFIGDEVHGLGASKTKKGLAVNYTYRLGLSATPTRWFDVLGTKIINDYFGNEIFSYTLEDAIYNYNPITHRTYLSPYKYVPIFVHLTDEELDDYIRLSEKIRRLSSYVNHDDEYQKRYESILFERSRIIKNAGNKISELKKLLQENTLDKALIFTSERLIDQVIETLYSLDINCHRLTEKQGTVPRSEFNNLTERQYLIEQFKDGVYKALVAIKCMDEGIDIPEADTAILLASSSNPREYIQRIGRVIRQSPNKRNATIYDFIVEPDLDRITDCELADFEREIFIKELNRTKEMAQTAINQTDIIIHINEKIRRASNGYK